MMVFPMTMSQCHIYHSVLPLTTFVFSKQSGCMPDTLQNVRVLASTAVFFASILRHFWWWTGVRPVSRSAMQHLLRTTRASCVLCPGGVRECYYMQPLRVQPLPADDAQLHKPPPMQLHGTEVVYLKKRSGFVRVALEEGVDLVCVLSVCCLPHTSPGALLFVWADGDVWVLAPIHRPAMPDAAVVVACVCAEDWLFADDDMGAVGHPDAAPGSAHGGGGGAHPRAQDGRPNTRAGGGAADTVYRLAAGTV